MQFCEQNCAAKLYPLILLFYLFSSYQQSDFNIGCIP